MQIVIYINFNLFSNNRARKVTMVIKDMTVFPVLMERKDQKDLLDTRVSPAYLDHLLVKDSIIKLRLYVSFVYL